MKRYPLVKCILNPGDAIFFHSNLLHASAQVSKLKTIIPYGCIGDLRSQNRSLQRRWTMICSYNSADNDPVREHHHPRYHKLHKVEADALLKCTRAASTTDKWFFKPDKNLGN